MLAVQEFCRIYGQFFPFGDSEQLASLVFRGFGAGEKGVVGFQQFITALSTATRGSMEERITCESVSCAETLSDSYIELAFSLCWSFQCCSDCMTVMVMVE